MRYKNKRGMFTLEALIALAVFSSAVAGVFFIQNQNADKLGIYEDYIVLTKHTNIMINSILSGEDPQNYIMKSGLVYHDYFDNLKGDLPTIKDDDVSFKKEGNADYVIYKLPIGNGNEKEFKFQIK